MRRAKTICFANRNAAEVVVRRVMINRLATASQEKNARVTAQVKDVAAVLRACDVIQTKSSLRVLGICVRPLRKHEQICLLATCCDHAVQLQKTATRAPSMP